MEYRYVQGEYVGDTDVDVPGKGVETLHVWRNPETGTLVAVDNLEVPADRNFVNDPHADGVRIMFHDTFTGLPK